MADRAILDIEVNDSRAQAYFAAWEKHQTVLENSNALLAKMNAHTTQITKAQGGLVATFAGVTKESKTILGHVKEITKHLGLWGVIVGAVTGLLGFGSMWGLERLSNDIMNRRRLAMGFGANFGAVSALGLNTRSFLGEGGGADLLGNIRTARMDPSSPQFRALMAAGFRPEDLRKSPTDIAWDLLSKVPQLLRGAPGAELQVAKALGLTELLSPDAIAARLNMSEEEFRLSRERAKADAKALDLSKDAQRGYTDFNSAMRRAAATVTNIIGEKLAALAEPLQRLMGAFVGAARKLADRLPWDKIIGKFADWIDELASFLTSPDFQKSMSNLINGIKWVFEKISSFNSMFGSALTPDTKTGKAGGALDEQQPLGDLVGRIIRSIWKWDWTELTHPGSSSIEKKQDKTLSMLDTIKTLLDPFGVANAAGFSGVGGAPASIRARGAGAMGPYLGGPTGTRGLDPGLVAKIREHATKWGVDPEAALAVYKSEGPGSTLNYMQPGDYGAYGPTSFGPYQLRMGEPGSVGYEYFHQTGYHPSDPRHMDEYLDFTFKWVRKHGWGSWMGAGKIGITGRHGVGPMPEPKPPIGPLSLRNWQRTYSPSLVMRSVPGANVYATVTGMAGGGGTA